MITEPCPVWRTRLAPVGATLAVLAAVLAMLRTASVTSVEVRARLGLPVPGSTTSRAADLYDVVGLLLVLSVVGWAFAWPARRPRILATLATFTALAGWSAALLLRHGV